MNAADRSQKMVFSERVRPTAPAWLILYRVTHHGEYESQSWEVVQYHNRNGDRSVESFVSLWAAHSAYEAIRNPADPCGGWPMWVC